MSLPRKCQCGMFVAPHFAACPKCNAPMTNAPVQPPRRKSRNEQRAAKHASAKVIKAKRMTWKPSTYATEAHTRLVAELRERIAQADTDALRHALRGELRLAKATLASAAVERAWSYRLIPNREQYLTVFVSPSGREYVRAAQYETPALIIAYGARYGRLRIPLVRTTQSRTYKAAVQYHETAQRALAKSNNPQPEPTNGSSRRSNRKQAHAHDEPRKRQSRRHTGRRRGERAA